MRISVTHDIDDLANDLAGIPVQFATRAPRIVKKNVTRGTKLAQRIAREKSGPHGKFYYKRISGEMTGPLSGEYGPTGTPKSNFVGAGFRNSAPNMDLPNSADVQGPLFAKDVGDLLDELFW